MGETSSFTESKNIKIEKALLQQKISDVYIGVFFDGTNNNMVQKARFTNTGKNFVTKKVQEARKFLHKLKYLAQFVVCNQEFLLRIDIYFFLAKNTRLFKR